MGINNEGISEVTMNKKESINYDIIVQYDGLESDLANVYKRVRNAYKAAGNDENTITDIRLYIKPQDFTAYYVVNGDYTGKVGLF